ncbi:UvrD-helicase domain-containing protein [Burkholderia pseudomallei]|uniref:UvrD-helicase domain-containing protein n=1 Tax=Burkholderia pseudomallei TaxID=28450 RepID=UPI001AB0184B|nr:UvrD-helicase domain-containing protein [Burkholderia pseudomallei]MBO3056569.1 UvrD-helicase domain-containing protein [Burkholderia pseudomallei]
MPPEIDLLAFNRGSITAPAGCGKTQLITDTLSLHDGAKPILVLTHTNAGVSALRSRLQRARVPSSAYRVFTIDGFAIRLIGKFPLRSGHDPRVLVLENPRQDYPAIREAAFRLLHAGHVSDALRATYSRLMVDEYQDCNLMQHAIVDWAAVVLPTCVLGDPLQAIFGFGNNQLVSWENNVLPQFPEVGALQTPWRWRLAGTERLGNWLLGIRQQLSASQAVDLRGAPQELEWIQLRPATALQQRLIAARTQPQGGQGNVLVIGKSTRPAERYQLASQTPGATTVEQVGLDDLTNFARRFNVAAADALAQLVEFAASLMTGVGATELLRRVQSIRQGRGRNTPTVAEAAAVTFAEAPSLGAALTLLTRLSEQDGTRVYRPEILRCCFSAMQTAIGNGSTFQSAAVQAREYNRYKGRPLGRRSVGSTLLLKGLEADVAVILHPETLDANNLYVALTRGAHRVIVCSESPILVPAR